jgi:hypothetical protein
MSAFVVSKRDIDAVVTVALEQNFSNRPANELGKLLWLENVKSVAYRYGMPARHADEHHGYLADVNAYAFEPCPLSDGAASKIVHCLDYQSCEHDEWPTSEAGKLVNALIAKLPSGGPDYDKAPWGNIERVL